LGTIGRKHGATLERSVLPVPAFIFPEGLAGWVHGHCPRGHQSVLTSGASAWLGPAMAEMGSLPPIPRPCRRTATSNITYSLSNVTYGLEKQQTCGNWSPYRVADIHLLGMPYCRVIQAKPEPRTPQSNRGRGKGG
jgi:hypothetical protein